MLLCPCLLETSRRTWKKRWGPRRWGRASLDEVTHAPLTYKTKFLQFTPRWAENPELGKGGDLATHECPARVTFALRQKDDVLSDWARQFRKSCNFELQLKL